MSKKKKKKAKTAKRKSSKRSLAAKRAARTRAANKAKRSLSARKAARSRKRHVGGGRKRAAKRSKHRRSKARRRNPVAKKRAAKKPAARKAKHTSYAVIAKKNAARKPISMRPGSPGAIYAQTLRVQHNCEMKIARLKAEGLKAVGAEKERKVRAIAKLEAMQARTTQRLAEMRREVSAAAARRRKGKSKSKSKSRKYHRKARRRNPIFNPLNPLAGWGEAFAGGSGVVLGALFTIGGDRFAATHALVAVPTTQESAGYLDSPTQGQVLNISAANLPLWADIKHSGWKRILSALVNIGAPLLIAEHVDHAKTKTFFQLWGFTALGLTGAKVAVDVTAKMAGKTELGMRLFSPETTAVSARTTSLVAAPGPASVAQGSGYSPALTGYGRGTGFGHGKCQCKKKEACNCAPVFASGVSAGGGCPPLVPPGPGFGPPAPRPQAPSPAPSPPRGVLNTSPTSMTAATRAVSVDAANAANGGACRVGVTGNVRRLHPNDGPSTGRIATRRR